MASKSMRSGWRLFTGVFVLPSVATAWWYRPIGNWKQEIDGPTRTWPSMSEKNIHDELHEGSPFYLDLARSVLAPAVIIFWRVIANYSPLRGSLDVRKDENYEAFLGHLTRRKANQPLITVANHRSLLDDPLVMCNLLPWHIGVQPRYLRWAICAQDFCYNEQLPSLINAFFGAGQSLPVWRGGGINQRPWLDFARHVANGDWCHVFPEAGIWQKRTGKMGGRGSPAGQDMAAKPGAQEALRKVGKLKWGVGKLIAHSPIPPVVVPFHHIGMEVMLEQSDSTRRLVRPIYKARPLSKGIKVIFGKAIDFSDLIEEFENKHGKLRKLTHSAKADSMAMVLADPAARDSVTGDSVNFHRYWDSTPDEMELYSRITRRIEEAVDSLCDGYEAEQLLE